MAVRILLVPTVVRNGKLASKNHVDLNLITGSPPSEGA